MSLSPQGQMAVYAVQGNNQPLATMGNCAMTFSDPEGAKAPTVKLITPIATLDHCKKCHSACNEAGLSATVTATNASVKDFCVVIAGSITNKVALSDKQCCSLQKQ
jgi:hypothetical protein